MIVPSKSVLFTVAVLVVPAVIATPIPSTITERDVDGSSNLEARQVRIVKDNWSTLAQAGFNQAKKNHQSNEAHLHQSNRIPLATRLPSYASTNAPARKTGYGPKLSKFQRREPEFDIEERDFSDSEDLEGRQVRVMKDNWSTLAQAGLNQAKYNHKSNEAKIHQDARIPIAMRLPSHAQMHAPPARKTGYGPKLSKFQRREPGSDFEERDFSDSEELEARQVRVMKDNWSTLAQGAYNQAKSNHKSNEAQIHQSNRIPIATRLPSYQSQHTPSKPTGYRPKLSKFQKREPEFDLEERDFSGSEELEARQMRIVKDNWSTLAQAGFNQAKSNHKSNEAHLHQSNRILAAARLPSHASTHTPSKPIGYGPKLSKFQRREMEINEMD